MTVITIAKRSLLEILENYRKRVNSNLEDYLSSISLDNSYQSELKNIMKYSVLAGGKRFRPILTYTVANLFGIMSKKLIRAPVLLS